ncbi:MAG: hypothetical protein M3R25_06970 [Bacteroidota bacterium]|nr:hypothetical protein [Bacteroidota bacterium]
MNIKILIKTCLSALFTMAVLLTVSDLNAQTNTRSESMQHCCMMKDGKMMVMKNGKTRPMKKKITMKNGTKCMVNGECTMKDGKKMMMKEGDCMEKSGEMCTDSMKAMSAGKKETAMVYACPMHPDVTSANAGKCSKCGMDLKRKN